jgi:mycothiol synthase
VLPPGYSLRGFRAGDEAVLTRLQNTVFQGSWGFSPNTVEQVAWRLAIPGFGPDNVLVLMGPDGEEAGYNWTRSDAEDGAVTGRIHMTGILPERRGLGLGRAVVAAGIRHLASQGARSVELEVDSANPAAVDLYGKLGFTAAAEQDWYELLRV